MGEGEVSDGMCILVLHLREDSTAELKLNCDI